LAKVSGISAVEVDAAATAWMRTEGNKQPSKKVLEKAIGRRVTNLEKVVRPVPAAEYVITLEGMA